MKIGIIGAMEEEVTLLRDKIENRQTLSLGGCEIYTGQLNGVDVALLKSGIGKVAAALGATLLLERCKPDVIINTGSAGGLAPTLKVGDIVVSDEARYHDADVTAFGYEYGQLPGCPAGFKADDKLIAAAESCINELNLNAVRGLIVSGDAFINGSVGLAKIRHNFPQAVAVEMEATAIAHVCHNFSVPFVVVRAISDVADQQSHISFDEFGRCGQAVHRDGGNPGAETGAWVRCHSGRWSPCFCSLRPAHRRAAVITLPCQYGTGVCRRDHARCGEQLFRLSTAGRPNRTGCHGGE